MKIFSVNSQWVVVVVMVVEIIAIITKTMGDFIILILGLVEGPILIKTPGDTLFMFLIDKNNLCLKIFTSKEDLLSNSNSSHKAMVIQ
jgi:hypothetical protein